MTGFEIFISTMLALFAFHIQFSYKLMINEERSRTILLTHIKYWSSKLEIYDDNLNLYERIFSRALSMNSEGENLIFSLIPASREIWAEDIKELSSKIDIKSNEDQLNKLQTTDGEKNHLHSLREGIMSGVLLPDSEELKNLSGTEAAGCILLKHDLLEWILNSETISESAKNIQNTEDGAHTLLKVFTNIERAKIICKILTDHSEAFSSKHTAAKITKRLLFRTNR